MTSEELLRQTDPFAVFTAWYDEIQQSGAVREPTAMTLATADRAGRPSARTVLLKRYSPEDGFVFFTNYDSQKGRDLTANPQAALLFYWDHWFRQIKIQGRVKRVTRKESEQYWQTRPFDSRVAGWMSRQSEPVPKEGLDQLYAKAQTQWQGRDVPCPENWGGFALIPERIEFWVGHRYRLHDRVRFERHGSAWRAVQLFP